MHKPLAWLVVLAALAAAAPAAAAPTLDLFPGDVEDVPVGTPGILNGAVGNSGDATATVTRLEISGADAARFAFVDVFTDTQIADCSGGLVCAESIAVDPGSFLNFDISCTPDHSALFTATITVTSDASNNPTSGTMFCDAAGPHVTFDPPALSFADTAIGFSSLPQIVTVTNTGPSDIHYELITAADFASSLDDIDCADDPCTLFAGGSITVALTFNPLISGAINEQLIFNADDGSGAASLPLSGSATGPQITVETPAGFVKPLNLGTTLFGTTTAAGTVRIRNTGNAPLVIAAALAIGSESGAYTVTTGPALPTQLAPGDTASWSITCSPVRIGGNSAIFTIENNSGIPEFPVPLNCIGSGGVVAVNSPEIPTTQVGQISTVPMVVSNAGSLPVTISAFATSDPEFTVSPPAGGLPITLAVGATATFSLSFAPTSGGPHTTQFTIANDGVLPFVGGDRAIGHTGTADLTPAGPDAGFVALGSTGTVNATLTNNSDQPLTLTQVTIGDPALVQIDTSQLIGAQLNPDDELRFAIHIAPGALGPADTTVSFVFDQGAPTVVTVSATGAAPQLAVETWDGSPSDDMIDFGTILLGPPVFELFSITNIGTAELHLSSCAITGDAVFQFDPDCTATLAPNESADFHISFAPTTDGTYTATLAFMSDSNTMLSIPLHGVAMAAMPPPGGGSGSGSGSGSGGGHGGGGCSTTGTNTSGAALIALAIGLIARRSRSRRPRSSLAAATVILVGCAGPGDRDDQASQPVAPAVSGIISVVRTGTGEGTVSSLDPGIDCGSTCSMTATDDIHLAATPATGSIFVGWAGPCTGTGPCVVVPAATPTQVTARFEHQFTITVATSGAAGEVTLDGTPCPMPCSRQALQGTQLSLDAFTPSSFAGWAGLASSSCPGTPSAPAPCTLTVTSDASITAQFAPLPGEASTIIVADFATTAVTSINAGADPIAAGVDALIDDTATGATAAGTEVLVARYGANGTRSWLIHLPTGNNPHIVGLDHDASDQIFVLSHADDPNLPFGVLFLHKLSPAGTIVWSVELDNTSQAITEDQLFDPDPFTNRGLVLAPGGDVLTTGQDVAHGTFVRAFATADGSVRWTHLTQTTPLAVLVSADGTITVPGSDNFDRGVVDRFDPDGNAVAHYDLPALPAENFPEFAFRSFAIAGGDQLVCTSADQFGIGSMVIRAVDLATGAPIWKLDGLSPAIGDQVALRTDPRFAAQAGIVMVDSTGAIRELFGRTIVDRVVSDHFASPGGLFDFTAADDITVSTSVYEVGNWTRGCPLSGRCDDGQSRTSGFVRTLQLP